ncbi:hypothetical protein Tco_0805081 [Tanacetum coccineum]
MPVCDDSSSKNEGLDDIVSIPPGKEIDHLDAIPDSVQSLLNRANSIIFLIEEFAGELAPIDPIPPFMLLIFYNSNSSGFDQYQPPQYFVTHQPPQEKSMAELLLEEKLP